MKNKRGSGATVAVLIMLGILVLGGIGALVYFVGIAPQTGVGDGTGTGTGTGTIAQQVNEGDVAQLKVYVEDASAQNTQTKVAVATYCKDSKGNLIIDGTSSSTSAEISGSTTRGETITCWAFNSTYQTVSPVVTTMDGEVQHAVVKAFRVTTNGALTVYGEVSGSTISGTAGKVNVTGVGVDQTGTLQKIRYKNNNTNQWMPLGGFYFDKVAGSNISLIDITGSASLYGVSDHTSTNIVASTLDNRVSSRSDKWDFVFEVDDKSAETGNQAIILEGSDYLDSGTVKVTGNGNGCDLTASPGELVSTYAFSKGYFRSTKTNDISYGHQNDAPAGAVISTDAIGSTFYCVGD